MEIHQYSRSKIIPPPLEDRINSWRIALIANLIDGFERKSDDPLDAGAEFDRLQTVEAIAAALESDGHTVFFVEANRSLPEALMKIQPHICFNIAEGIHGDGREAQVPALCELLGIPYTASQVVANAISLNKTMTKRIWQQQGLPTAPYYEFNSLEDIAHAEFRFPLFAKPSREGTGMGINNNSVINDYGQLIERVEWLLNSYHQPVLVEEFLPGREFTVGFIGNRGNPTFRKRPELYDVDGYHWFPVLEIDTLSSISPTIYGHDAKELDIGSLGAPNYLCPADISESLRARLIDLTRRAAEALEVRDVSRVDFRVGADGEPYLLEINTLPGLNPNLSDLCIMAAAEGMSHHMLITEILYLAAERYQLEFLRDAQIRSDRLLINSFAHYKPAEPRIQINYSGLRRY
ncbi:MAG: D-alanine--D-alanine ligase family protein [Anaerolineales bacterium]